MKKSSNILRLAVGIALLFATSNYTYAQFGGLLNAAKKKAQEKIEKTVDKKVKEQTDPQRNLPKPDADQGDVEFYYASGNRLGLWHPKTRTFERFAQDESGKWISQSYTFKEDGSVVFEDGNRKGEINANGTMNSTKTQGISLDKSTGEVKHNGAWVGKVDDDGNVYMFNDKMIRANSPIDKEVEAYVLFNMIATNELLAEYKQKYDARVKEIQESRQAQLASAKANQRNEAAGGGKAMRLWKGGSVAGEIRANNEVWIGGSNRGKFSPNGDIWVGGSVAGQILNSGDIRKNGSIIGKVQGNKVWLGGSIVGEIRNNGDVVKGGSIVGRVDNMSDVRKVAVLYFFSFYNF